MGQEPGGARLVVGAATETSPEADPPITASPFHSPLHGFANENPRRSGASFHGEVVHHRPIVFLAPQYVHNWFVYNDEQQDWSQCNVNKYWYIDHSSVEVHHHLSYLAKECFGCYCFQCGSARYPILQPRKGESWNWTIFPSS